MVTVDLVTGFLGAGKTTFIHGYLHYLQSQGWRVQIIENEFGEMSVDSHLLENENCEVEDLSGLCMCCVGKDAFIRMLEESADSGCDRILVEPSGIYDVDEFFEVLSLPRIADCCEIGSIITIADPDGIDYLTDEAEYLMFAQLLASGIVILSKTQFLWENELENFLERLNDLMRKHGCEAGVMADICKKDWSDFTEQDYEDFAEAGYARIIHDRESFLHTEIFRSVSIIGHSKDEPDLNERLDLAFASSDCGRIFRVKGFVLTDCGMRYEVNCTPETRCIRETSVREEILVVIGQKIKELPLKNIFSKR